MARQFGATWWGRAWIDALEQRARLDPNRLPRGRTYARHDRVEDLVLAPGEITASVHGSRARPYRVTVRFREFERSEWDRFIELIVSRAAWMAALLDGELDHELSTASREAGVDLLPGPGELHPRCSCPDWADPCKHAAAVCYLVADALDDDPFALLWLRGRDRESLVAAVRRARAEAGDAADGDDAAPREMLHPDRAAEDPGLRASIAWHRPLGALPDAPPVRPAPGRVASWPVDPPDEATFTADGLRSLASDAVERAWEALLEGRPVLGSNKSSIDLARRVAAHLDGSAESGRAIDAMARRAGTRTRTLVRLALAWEVAGASGVAVIDEPAWRPPPMALAAARDAVLSTGVPPSRLQITNNRVTVDRDIQLRLSRDGSWYSFVKRRGAWHLDAGPAEEADDLLD